MAYFDSEKNRAMWQKRLQTLEKERDRRRQNGYKPTEMRRSGSSQNQASMAGMSETRPGVRIISFDELVAKEERRHMERIRAARARQREAVPQMQGAAPTPAAQAAGSRPAR